MATTVTMIFVFVFIISPRFDYAYVPEYNATNDDFVLALLLNGIAAIVVDIIVNDKILLIFINFLLSRNPTT